MRQRLSIEWMKLKNYRTFWILLSLYLLCIFGVNYIVFSIQQQILADKQAKGMLQMIIGIPYSFPTVWQMTAYVSSYLLFIPGLLTIISVTNEYSYKTHRQNIIDGWNRRQFIHAKIYFVLILAILSTIMVTLSAALFGTLEGSYDFSLDRFYYIGYFFLLAMNYSMVALLLGVLFRRGGLAIGVYFLYTNGLEDGIAALLNKYANYSGRYMPLESSDKLIPAPSIDKVMRQFGPAPNYTIILIVVLVYLSLFFFISRRRFETADL